MLKNVKLGTKILVGFAVQVVIACVLGGITVYNMQHVEEVAGILIRENVPQVDVAGDIQRLALETMYEVRGYAFTEDTAYLARGRAHAADLKQHFAEAKALASSSPRLERSRSES